MDPPPLLPSSPPPTPPSMHFDVLSLRSYRFCVGQCRNLCISDPFISQTFCLSVFVSPIAHKCLSPELHWKGWTGRRSWPSRRRLGANLVFSTMWESLKLAKSTNPCGGYRLRLLGTQRSAQPKFCQLETFICMELEFLRLRAQNATSHFSPARLLYSAPCFRPPLHYSS